MNRRPVVAAHPLELYRWAVQDPLVLTRVMQVVYARCWPGRVPVTLREDFAGTAMDAIAWTMGSPGRRAVAVEIDEATVAWARARAGALLGSQAERVTFVCGDVREVGPPAVPHAHILAALNFSLFEFHTREALCDYFRGARRSLHEHGILIANVFGGPERQRAHVRTVTVADRTGLPGEVAPSPFVYEWQQQPFDALTGRVDCSLHFDLGTAGGAMRDAFRYRYRMWTLPELVEVAREAGFRDVRVWLHELDATGAVALGPVESLAGRERWVVYLVASG